MGNNRILLILILIFVMQACTSVISERTDEEAWTEYRLEFQADSRRDRSLSRVPSSEGSVESQKTLKLRSRLDQIPVRQILLHCGSVNSIEACYRDQLIRRFDLIFQAEKARNPLLTDRDYREEQNRFLRANAYDEVLGRVDRFHQKVLSGIQFSARDQVLSLFKKCEGESDESVAIELSRFGVIKGIVTEMPKSVYACLSHDWESNMDQLVSDASQRLGLRWVTAGAREWIEKRLIGPLYDSELAQVLNQKSQSEFEAFTKKRDSIFHGFNSNEADPVLVATWAPILRKAYPYSRVEQWILEYKSIRKKTTKS